MSHANLFSEVASLLADGFDNVPKTLDIHEEQLARRTRSAVPKLRRKQLRLFGATWRYSNLLIHLLSIKKIKNTIFFNSALQV
jgi:hypothetical protein